jgi:hypothetical protein
MCSNSCDAATAGEGCCVQPTQCAAADRRHVQVAQTGAEASGEFRQHMLIIYAEPLLPALRC